MTKTVKQYFYSNGKDQFGPFTMEELGEQGIARETYVWHEEMEDWKQAGSLDELKDLFKLIPPSIPHKPRVEHSVMPAAPNNSQGIDTLVFICICLWFISNLFDLIMREVFVTWYDHPIRFVRMGLNLIFAFLPIAFSLSIKSKKLRIIGIIIGALITINLLYGNIDWIIRDLS